MPSPAIDRRKSCGTTALAVALGIGTGFALRPRGSSGSAPPGDSALQAAEVPPPPSGGEIQTPGGPKLRSRPTGDGLTFSRKQWRELQRKSPALQIDLTDCLLWKRTIETPVENEPGWGSDGYSTKKIDGGPDLGPITAFLGLDETKSERLRETLQRFGERLRDIERENARLEYAGDGTARIGFGDETTSRREAFTQLDRELVESLGARDASRFSAATGLVPDEATANTIELRATVTGNFLRVAIPGSREVLMPRDRAAIPEDMFARVQHLGLDIDWERLVEEAGEEAPQR